MLPRASAAVSVNRCLITRGSVDAATRGDRVGISVGVSAGWGRGSDERDVIISKVEPSKCCCLENYNPSCVRMRREISKGCIKSVSEIPCSGLAVKDQNCWIKSWKRPSMDGLFLLLCHPSKPRKILLTGS